MDVLKLPLLVAVLLLVGCSHPLEIRGQGDIVSASGTRDCTFDQAPCENIVTGAYVETYSAVPAQGYYFVGWEGCGEQSPDCSFNIPAEVVADFYGASIAPLVALFELATPAPPVANAGLPQVVNYPGEVSLDGTGSRDPNTDIASFEWVQIAGSPVDLSNAGTATPSFVIPSEPGTLRFELVVTDEEGAIDNDFIDITVNSPPTLAVVFPISNSRFYGQIINVSGTLSQKGYETGVTVTVDAGSTAIKALIDVEGNWIAQNVPLPEDTKNITVTAVAIDSFDASMEVVTEIDNLPTLTSTLTAFDPQNPNTLYVLQDIFPSEKLVAIDLVTQQRSVIYDSNGSYGGLSQAWDVAFDTARNRLLILDVSGKSIKAIDIYTGNLETISSSSVGSGPQFEQPYNIAIDSVNDRLLVVDKIQKALLSVDLVSGDRTVVSDNTIGGGNSFGSLNEVVVDTSGDFAYVLDTNVNRVNVYDRIDKRIIEVDLDTGRKTVISGNTTGSGDSLYYVSSLVFDSVFNRLGALDWRSDKIMTINLAYGRRTTLSAAGTSGIELGNPRQALLDSINNRYIVDDISQNYSSADSDAIVGIDVTSGERSILLEERVGEGPEIESHKGSAFDFEKNIAYVADFSIDALFKVDLLTGRRELFSDENNGAGDNFGRPMDVALDKTNNRVLVANIASDIILSVDLASANRTVVASLFVGSGPLPTNPRALAYRESNNTLLIIDADLNALIQLNLTNFERTIISDASNGSGDEFTNLVSFALDSENNRALVIAGRSVIAVDLATGYRTTLSTGFVSPSDIAIDRESNLAIISDTAVGLKAIDLESGYHTTIADSEKGHGEPVVNIQEIAIDPNSSLIYAMGTNFEAIFAIDKISGDRVIVSK